MGIHHITNETDYEKQLEKAGSKLVVIKFYASWCGHCSNIAPIFSELHEGLKNEVVFLEVDIDENGDITKSEYVNGIPTFVFYKEKKRLDVASGAKLKELISQYK